ncbi:carbamoyltransferase N-terminal domain-containing protein [Nocardia sp. NPDC051990]
MICGISMSHHGGVAVIEDDRLIFGIEPEKRTSRGLVPSARFELASTGF